MQQLIDDGADPNDPGFANLWPDSWMKVFHPNRVGHYIIANKVMYHLAATRSGTSSSLGSHRSWICSSAFVRLSSVPRARHRVAGTTAAASSATRMASHCVGDLSGCSCVPESITCDAPQPCDQNNCNGTYDADTGKATCKNFFKNCERKPIPQTAGVPSLVMRITAMGASTWILGVATCWSFFSGCVCNQTPQDLR